MPPPHDPIDEGGGHDPVLAAQLDALTQAIQDLTARVGGAPGAAPGADAPWWFKFTQGKPEAPESLPPWHHAAGESGAWWSQYTAPSQERLAFVRGHWRRPPQPRPPMVTAAAPTVTAAAADIEAAVASAPAAAGSREYPEHVYKAAEATGESPDDIAAAFGIKGRRRAAGGGGGKPPGGRGPGGPSDDSAPGSPDWNRKRKRHGWAWQGARKAGGIARLKFGRRAGQSVTTGIGVAARRLMWGASVGSAARGGAIAAVAAGGPVAIGVAALGFAAVKAAEALNRMTAEQLVYNRHLAQSSAQMAMVFAERDVQERMREREKGDRLAGSARALAQAEQGFAEGTKETEILWNRAKNEIAAEWETFKTVALSEVEVIATVLNKTYEWLEERFGISQQGAMTFDQWMKDMQQGDMDARRRKDPKWNSPTFK
jgi:hypothetical protein